jgi:hypothetical protein
VVEDEGEAEVEDVSRSSNEVIQEYDTITINVISIEWDRERTGKTNSVRLATTQPIATVHPLVKSASTTLMSPSSSSSAVIPIPSIPFAAVAANPTSPPIAPLAAAMETVDKPVNSRQSMIIETQDGPPSYDRRRGEAKVASKGGRRIDRVR